MKVMILIVIIVMNLIIKCQFSVAFSIIHSVILDFIAEITYIPARKFFPSQYRAPIYCICVYHGVKAPHAILSKGPDEDV